MFLFFEISKQSVSVHEAIFCGIVYNGRKSETGRREQYEK